MVLKVGLIEIIDMIAHTANREGFPGPYTRSICYGTRVSIVFAKNLTISHTVCKYPEEPNDDKYIHVLTS